MAPTSFFRGVTPVTRSAVGRAANNAQRQAEHNAQNPDHQVSSWDVVTNTIDGASEKDIKANAKEGAIGAAGMGAIGLGASLGGRTLGGLVAAGVGAGTGLGFVVTLAESARSIKTIADKVKIRDSYSASSKGAEKSMEQTWDGMKEQWENMPDSVLGKVGATFGLLVGAEQMLSALASMIPFPALPAVRVLDMDVGLPHIHGHPPNVIPPAPPIALPSTGPIIPIPLLSGANQTLINNMPAARCGDMGLGIWCGGFFPMYEVFLGSSSVWIEGARAARVFVDITKHCVFTCPKPQDPPTGPMIGFTTSSSGDVLIGGVPLPSLTALAIGGAIKGLFRGFGAIFRKLTAKSYVDKLLKNGVEIIDRGDAAYAKAVKDDLVKIAKSRTGRNMLNDLQKNLKKIKPQKVTIEKWHGRPLGENCMSNMNGVAKKAGGTGKGAGSEIFYDPAAWPKAKGTPGAGTPSDAVAFHELNHANNNAAGKSMYAQKSKSTAWNQKHQDYEEFKTTNADNTYRAEQGYVKRPHYTAPLK